MKRSDSGLKVLLTIFGPPIVTIFFLTGMLLGILAGQGWAATRTISDAGGNWNSTGTWVEGAVPTTGDAVVATATSGNLAINVDTATIGSFDLTNYTHTLSGSTNYIYCSGNVTLPNGFTNSLTKAIRITGTSTLTVGSSQSIYILDVWGSSANVSLGADTTFGAECYIQGGTFNTNNHTITTPVIGDEASALAKTLNLGSSTINVTGNSPGVAFTGGNLTVSSNTATINMTPTTGTPTEQNFGSTSWPGTTINLTARASTVTPVVISGTNTFTNLTLLGVNNTTWPGTFQFKNDQTITGTLTMTGYSQILRPIVTSNTTGTTRTLTLTGATVNLTDVDLSDLTFTGSPTVTSTRVGDLGGNTNAGTSSPKTVYAGAITSTQYMSSNIWADSTHAGDNYATRAAAVNLNNVPLPQDTAVIDNSSFSAASKTFRTGYTSGNGLFRIGAIDASGVTTAETIQMYAATCYGNLNLTGSGVTISNSAQTLTFDSGLGNISIAAGNFGSGPFVINSRGNSVKATGAVVTTGTTTLTQGTLDLNNNNLTCLKFISSNSNSRTLTDSGTNGTLILTGVSDATNKIFDTTTATNFATTSAPNIQIGDGTITQTADVTFMGAGQTYGNLTVKKHAGNYSTVISGANTFGTVTCETPNVTYQYSGIKFPQGVTTNLTSLVADGAASYPITLTSSDGAHAATLRDTSGTNKVTNCAITWLPVTGGATWTAAAGDGNTLDANSTGWNAPVGGGGLSLGLGVSGGNRRP